MGTIISSFLLIFLAEMGDKTQLLALAFSTKYKVTHVLLGVFIGVLLNHGLAIVFGSFISTYISIEIIETAASFMFIMFGLWSLKLEYEDDDSESINTLKNPILTVASAFFVGELGDKTQLTAMALGASSSSPFMVLIGTTSGMILVSLIGIIVGKILGKKIPEVTMKILASIIFIGFGLSGLYASLNSQFLTSLNITVFLALIIFAVVLIAKTNVKNQNIYYEKKLSALISSCNHCTFHNSDCSISIQIKELTQKYLGQDLPYIGNIILYFESMKKVAPKKATHLEKTINKNIK